MSRGLIPLLSLVVLACPDAGLARDGPEEPAPIVITIRPAASPVPALKYRLLPERRELIPGNAAIFYHRAIERLIQTRSQRSLTGHAEKKSASELNEEEQKLQSDLMRPLSDFRKEVVSRYLEQHEFCLREIELGTRREFCDWEFQHRDEGFDLVISEIQEARGLGRLVVLKTRLELAEGRMDAALHWLQVGLVLARHAAEGHIFIQSLVGAAIAFQMTDVLQELIQTPGAPNLYWALANRPRPLIDISAAIEGERYALEKEIPRLRELDSGPWSLDQARAFADELKQKASLISDVAMRISSSTTHPELKDLGEHLIFAGLVARAYPSSKRALIEQGKPASVVEAMPAIQVVALHSYRLFQEARDDIFKWSGLPYWQGFEGMRRANEEPRAGWAKLKSGIPFVLILPAIGSVFVVPVRSDRRLDVIQVIEAIRLYAAAHQGEFPPSLDALTDSPAPLDSATGKPFNYERREGWAFINAPPPPGWNIPAFRIRYELKPAR